MLQHYELVYLLSIDATEQQHTQITDEIKKIIGEGGTVKKSGEIGKRKLAYPIKHQTHANYWLFEFEADTAIIEKIHRMLSLNAHVLRFLFVATKPKTPEILAREEAMKQRLAAERVTEQERRQAPEEKKKEVKRVYTAPEKEPVITTAKEPEKEKVEEKISLEELDQKLEELLKDESLNE